MRLRPIVGQPGNSSIISRVKLRQTTVQLGKRAGFDDVGHRLGLTFHVPMVAFCHVLSIIKEIDDDDDDDHRSTDQAWRLTDTEDQTTDSAMPLTGAETVQERPLFFYWQTVTLTYNTRLWYSCECTVNSEVKPG